MKLLRGSRGRSVSVALLENFWGEPGWTVAAARLKLLALEADTPIDHSCARGGWSVDPWR